MRIMSLRTVDGNSMTSYNLHEKPNKFGKSAIYSATLQYFSFRLKLCVDLPVKTSENVVTALQFGVLERKFYI